MNNIHLRSKVTLNNTFFNPPQQRKHSNYRPHQLAQFRNGEVRDKIKITNIQRVENSLAVIGYYKKKTLLQISPSFWLEIAKHQVANLPEHLQRQMIENFCKTLK